jgi:hypothetical protein
VFGGWSWAAGQKKFNCYHVNKVKEDRASKSRSWRDGARVLVAHATNTNWQENS